MGLVPFEALRDHEIDFVFGQLGEHRERHAGCGVLFRVRERARDARAFAPRIASLLVNRDGVVRLRVNGSVVEEFNECVALGRDDSFDDVKMEHVAITRRFVRQGEVLRAFEACGVTRGEFAAVVVPLVDVLELGAQDTGVNVVETAVETVAVNVTGVGAVAAQLANRGVHVGIVRNERTAVTEGAEVLLNDEAGRSRIAQFADFETVAGCANGLGVVFDDKQLMLVGDFADGLHVSALAVKVNRHDGLGLRRDGRFDFRGVNALGLGIAINQDGSRTGDPDGFGSGEESIGVGDAFVTSSDAEGHEREPDCIRAVADADGVFGAAVGGEFAFKALEHGPEHVIATLDYLSNVRINLGFDVVVLADMSVKIDFHGGQT